MQLRDDLGHGVVHELAVEVARELRQRRCASRAKGKRLPDSERAIDEAGSRLEQRDADALARQIPQCHDGPEARDAASGDDDVQWMVRGAVAHSHRSKVGPVRTR